LTVYIDEYWAGTVPQYWEHGGHLLTSDLDELHKFAYRLGLKREWFQDTTFPHYDCTEGKRNKALRLGAVSIRLGEFPDDLLVKNHDGNYERYDKNRKHLIKKAFKKET
jgi:hypothetical protein